MRYLALIYEPERPPDAEIDQAMLDAEMAAYGAFTAEIRDRGIFVAGEALQPSSTATTVRIRDGRMEATDGPFAETKEVLGGFYLLACRDLDEAIGLAARIPAAKRGSIEIRPIWEFPADYATAGAAEHAHAG
jgi:hypothetical protein